MRALITTLVLTINIVCWPTLRCAQYIDTIFFILVYRCNVSTSLFFTFPIYYSSSSSSVVFPYGKKALAHAWRSGMPAPPSLTLHEHLVNGISDFTQRHLYVRSGNSTALQSDAKSQTTNTFITSLWTNAGIFGIEILAFTILRVYFSRIY